MSEFLKLAVPVIMTALLAIVAGLFAEVSNIRDKQTNAIQYIIRIEHLEAKAMDYEDRLREITKRINICGDNLCSNQYDK